MSLWGGTRPGYGPVVRTAEPKRADRLGPTGHGLRGHGLCLPWSAPRGGPGGQPDPQVTNHRPSGTGDPRTGSRGVRSIPRAGRQPPARCWGGMAPEARPGGTPKAWLTGARWCGRARGQEEGIRHAHGIASDVGMARRPVAHRRPDGLYAPTAPLPSQWSWGYQDGAHASATRIDGMGRDAPRDPTGHPGPQRKTDRRGGGGAIPQPPPTGTLSLHVAPVPHGRPGPPGLGAYIWQPRTPAAWAPRHAGPGWPSPGQTRLGTGVGSAVRAQQRRLSPGPILPGGGGSDARAPPATGQIWLGG